MIQAALLLTTSVTPKDNFYIVPLLMNQIHHYQLMKQTDETNSSALARK